MGSRRCHGGALQYRGGRTLIITYKGHMEIKAKSALHPLALALLLATLCIGVFLRIGNLAGNALWLDESYTAFAAEKGQEFIWKVTPNYEVHPPFYYSLVNLWINVFGISLISYRALGVVCGLLTLFIMWKIGQNLAVRISCARSETIPLWAVIFGAFSPILVAMSREARPYPLLILAYCCGILLVLRLAHANRKNIEWLLYFLNLTVILWLHPLGAFFVASLVLALLVLTWNLQWRTSEYLKFTATHLLVLVLWAPAVAILIYQASLWVRSSWLVFSWSSVPQALVQIYGVGNWVGAIFAVGLAALGFVELKQDRRLFLAVFILAFLPLAGSLIATITIAPVFLPRTLSPASIPALIILSVGAVRICRSGKLIIRTLPAIFAEIQILGALQYPTHQRSQDWYSIHDAMTRLVKPSDVILAYPNESALPLRFAARDRGSELKIRGIPEEVPVQTAIGTHPTGTRGVVSISEHKMPAFASSYSQIGTIWLVQINPQLFDQHDHFGRTLSQGRDIIVDWKTDDTRVRAYRLAMPD